MNEPSAWISVGDLGTAFEVDANTLPPSADLTGRTLQLHFEDGRKAQCRFDSGTRLTWSGGDAPSEQSYVATSLRSGLYFVDFVQEGARSSSVSLLLDLNRNICTSIVGQLPTQAEAAPSMLERVRGGKELTAVTAQFAHGAIGTPFTAATPKHELTADLVDKRIEYTYSPTERYEHIYLNRSLYTWQCLQGSEQGLGDTDRCHYYKIDEQLYLFVWREKIVPTLGIVLVDLARLKTTGKIFGYRGYDFGAVTNFAVGARARVLNTTMREAT